jgi:hypothetical protein
MHSPALSPGLLNDCSRGAQLYARIVCAGFSGIAEGPNTLKSDGELADAAANPGWRDGGESELQRMCGDLPGGPAVVKSLSMKIVNTKYRKWYLSMIHVGDPCWG